MSISGSPWYTPAFPLLWFRALGIRGGGGGIGGLGVGVGVGVGMGV